MAQDLMHLLQEKEEGKHAEVKKAIAETSKAKNVEVKKAVAETIKAYEVKAAENAQAFAKVRLTNCGPSLKLACTLASFASTLLSQ